MNGLFLLEIPHRYDIIFLLLYPIQFCTTGLHPASGTYHPSPANLLHCLADFDHILHIFLQISQSRRPSSCNLLMFSHLLRLTIPHSRSVDTLLPYRKTHRKTLPLTGSFLTPFLRKMPRSVTPQDIFTLHIIITVLLKLL